MSLIRVENLTFAYEGAYDNIFENASFTIDTDWKLGLVGRNGRGKTTFLRLLMGEHKYSGRIVTDARFEYFPFEVADTQSLTAHVIGSVCPGAADWQIRRELSLLSVSEDVLYRPFCTLSHGERAKALLASLFLRESCFLLIDEPTNHLDMRARRIVGEYLSAKRGFILVSHDRAFLDSCVDHILSINRADIEVQKGNFSSWWDNRLMRESFALRQNEKLRRDIERLNETAKRTSDWSDRVEKTKHGTRNSGVKADKGYIGHKAAKMMKRAKAIEARRQSALKQKEGLLQNVESVEKLKIAQMELHTDRFAELRDISIRYGDKVACERVSFEIGRGDRVALCGGNGSGKTSILRLLRGEELDYTGTLYRASRLAISYVPQDTSFLRGSLTDFARECGVDETLFLTILRKLDFPRIQFEKDLADFSGGQKKKVLIARSLCEQAHIAVWDEPLNFVDVFSRIQIEELLLEYAPTMLFVEHDSAFCEHIATKIIEL
ncbi:MAG: ABC-F type ribosomal protection protein [Clostridiales bacterium]|nr:ABC-F type ribosomal protection protein [Clostridiales bacterium]